MEYRRPRNESPPCCGAFFGAATASNMPQNDSAVWRPPAQATLGGKNTHASPRRRPGRSAPDSGTSARQYPRPALAGMSPGTTAGSAQRGNTPLTCERCHHLDCAFRRRRFDLSRMRGVWHAIHQNTAHRLSNDSGAHKHVLCQDHCTGGLFIRKQRAATWLSGQRWLDRKTSVVDEFVRRCKLEMVL